jgi:hypothetical protein
LKQKVALCGANKISRLLPEKILLRDKFFLFLRFIINFEIDFIPNIFFFINLVLFCVIIFAIILLFLAVYPHHVWYVPTVIDSFDRNCARLGVGAETHVGLLINSLYIRRHEARAESYIYNLLL